jgi:hypothetical protein
LRLLEKARTRTRTRDIPERINILCVWAGSINPFDLAITKG